MRLSKKIVKYLFKPPIVGTEIAKSLPTLVLQKQTSWQQRSFNAFAKGVNGTVEELTIDAFAQSTAGDRQKLWLDIFDQNPYGHSQMICGAATVVWK